MSHTSFKYFIAAAALCLPLLAAADEPTIVGYWQVTWRDAGSGDVILKVWDVWNADRTETQNDNGPVPFGNVCQGAWIPLGSRTYGLTHPAFNFDAFGYPDDSVSYVILETVKVSNDGNSFRGKGFYNTIKGADPLDPSAEVLNSQNITITGKRVRVDRGQLPQL